MVPGVEQRHVVVRDGTRIGYQVRGRGPAIVLANGLGGTFEAFRHIYSALPADAYRVVCWDYRGLYSSSPPADPDALGMGRHVDDLEDVLAAEGIDRAVHIGWSMGVQANFEYVKRNAARVAGLFIINGTYGRPFRTVLSSRFVERVIPVLLRMVKAQAELVGRATRALAGSEALIGAMKRVGMVSDTIDLDVFRVLARGFEQVDWRIYSDLLHRLGEHDAEDALAMIHVPTSIVTGDRDIMTPPVTAEHIHRAIPGSRLVVIRGGTHYTPVEFPSIVQDELRKLLARVPGVVLMASLDESHVSCSNCGATVLDIDVKCPKCGHNLASTGAHRLIGSVVLGVYALVDVLGQGGMSVVYKGRHKMTEQEVALKILPPELAAHAQVKSRFLEEARALAQLDHPNIVHLYNFGQENGCFVLAMQYVNGRTWERMILEAGSLDWTVSVKIAVDVLRALEYAHGRGVVHRDMKPSNVLVRDDDGSATVMDFGIAKMTTSTRLTATGQTMGTVRYMSPEQVRGQEVDVRTDIYSLGATLYESLVGDTPFDGNTHFEIMTKHLNEPPRPPSVRDVALPPGLEAVIMRSLAKKMDDRYQTARDFRKELEAVAKEADVGRSETLRMSRDAVAQARTESGGQARAVPIKPANVAAAAAEVRMQSIADALEPDDAAEMTGPAKRPAPWLLIGLAGAVVIAGAVVAVMMLGGGKGRAKKAPPPHAGSAEHGPFLPPGIAFASQKAFPDSNLDVRCAQPCDLDAIAALHDDAVSRFRAFAEKRQHGVKIAVQPITLLVVPQPALCDARIYEGGTAPDDCGREGSYYRPLERTLLVVDDPAHLRANLSAGLAEVTCVHQENVAACDAIDAFAKEASPPNDQSGGSPH